MDNSIQSHALLLCLHKNLNTLNFKAFKVLVVVLCELIDI